MSKCQYVEVHFFPPSSSMSTQYVHGFELLLLCFLCGGAVRVFYWQEGISFCAAPEMKSWRNNQITSCLIHKFIHRFTQWLFWILIICLLSVCVCVGKKGKKNYIDWDSFEAFVLLTQLKQLNHAWMIIPRKKKKWILGEIRGWANIYWSGPIMQMSIYSYCAFPRINNKLHLYIVLFSV